MKKNIEKNTDKNIMDEFDSKDKEFLDQENTADVFSSLSTKHDSSSEIEEESLADNVRMLSPGKLVAKRFFRSKLSIVGLVLIIILFTFSFVGPLFDGEAGSGPVWGESEVDYTPVDAGYTYEDISVEIDGVIYTFRKETSIHLQTNQYASPSKDHWLGTDRNAFDNFTRLMYGGRISLTLGFVVVILETLIGIILGGLAGYFGKWVDMLIMRITDIFMCLPTFPILLIVCAVLDAYHITGNLKLYMIMIALTVFGWSGTARLVRGQILMYREQDFMLAAETLGLSTRRKIFKHLIPNIMPQLIVGMTLGLGGVILTEASLSYLGLGVSYPAAAWGSMINAAKAPEVLENYFFVWGPPGFCIILAILAFNFIGDGLRDALDPKMKR